MGFALGRACAVGGRGRGSVRLMCSKGEPEEERQGGGGDLGLGGMRGEGKGRPEMVRGEER